MSPHVIRLMMFGALIASGHNASAVPTVQSLGGTPPNLAGVPLDSALVANRTMGSHESERINIMDAPYGAKGDGVTDDSSAFAAAIQTANAAMATGHFPCIYLPAPALSYRISSTQLPTFRGPGCVEGDGPEKTFIAVDPNYSGDLFSWSEGWMAENYPGQSGSTLSKIQKAGPMAEGFSIAGSTTAVYQQNALVFYDRNDFVLLRDVTVSTINGRALYSGIPKYVPSQGYMRESVISNFRVFTAGSTGVPAVKFNTLSGSDDSTNEIQVFGMNIFSPNGPGLVIRGGVNTDIRNMTFFGLRIEGDTNPSSPIRGDLLDVGDNIEEGKVFSIKFYGSELIAPYASFCALQTLAQSPATQPYNIHFDGQIGPGPGKGLCISAGRSLDFRLSEISTSDTNVTVGASPLVGSDLLLDAEGAGGEWTYSIDPTSANSILSPVYKVGPPTTLHPHS